MGTSGKSDSNGMTNARMYEQVTDHMISLLEQGTAPWRRPWTMSSDAPLRSNGQPYRGINLWILLAENRQSRLWLTMKQINDWGGRVRKGEHSTIVYFWKRISITQADDEGNEKEKTIPLLRYYRVFNLEQTENVNVPKGLAEQCRPVIVADPIAEAEAIWNGYANKPGLEHGGDRAFYSITADQIQLPQIGVFSDIAEYHSTLFHEAGHSTGHETRLKRTFGQKFGDGDYGREELVAEMTAAFLCGEAGLGLSGKRIENSAAYLASWIRVLKADKAAVIVAAGAAQRAADWVMGRLAESSIDEVATAA